MPNRLDEAINLIESGDKEGGYQLLKQVLEADPKNARAWLWMATVVDSDELRIECLQESLKYAPHSKAARKALIRLQASRLGKCLGVYRSRDPLAAIVTLLVSVIGVFIIPVLIRDARWSEFLVLICILFALGGVWEVFMTVPKRQIALYDNGMIYRDKIIHWEDVTRVWQRYARVRYGLNISYWIEIKGEKRRLWLSNMRFPDVDSMGQIIQQRVTRCLLPKYAQALNAGKGVSFGKLTLDLHGIVHGRRRLPWEQVGQVDVKYGQVIIKKQGRLTAWHRALASEIPNIYVFLAIVDQLILKSQH